MSEWIDFKRERPPFDELVLVLLKDGEVKIDHRIEWCGHPKGYAWANQVIEDDEVELNVAYWMHIPEEPKKKHYCENDYMRCYTGLPDYDGWNQRTIQRIG